VPMMSFDLRGVIGRLADAEDDSALTLLAA
jgi:hypothetical protein